MAYVDVDVIELIKPIKHRKILLLFLIVSNVWWLKTNIDWRVDKIKVNQHIGENGIAVEAVSHHKHCSGKIETRSYQYVVNGEMRSVNLLPRYVSPHCDAPLGDKIKIYYSEKYPKDFLDEKEFRTYKIGYGSEIFAVFVMSMIFFLITLYMAMMYNYVIFVYQYESELSENDD